MRICVTPTMMVSRSATIATVKRNRMDFSVGCGARPVERVATLSTCIPPSRGGFAAGGRPPLAFGARGVRICGPLRLSSPCGATQGCKP